MARAGHNRAPSSGLRSTRSGRGPAAALPAGTVTFLFTDIEGSTALWERQPGAMRAALERHDALVRCAVEGQNGHVFKTVGDAFYAVFSIAADALLAALAAQHALVAEPWTGVGPLRVRMALHTGSEGLHDGDYFGRTLNRASRLLAAAHGGQIILSLSTAELLQDSLPAGATLRDLGEHRFRDVERPLRVFQVVAPDLPGELRPLRTAADALGSARSETAPADEPAPRALLEVHVLGGFQVLVRGRPVPGEAWRRRSKGRDLFKCLIARPRRSLSKDEAIDLFWPSGENPDQTLRSTLSGLRASLKQAWSGFDGTLIDGTQGLVRISPEAEVWVDAEAFERLIADARLADDPLPLLEAADALYAGDYLPDDLHDADWATNPRERLRQQFVELQLALAREFAARGESLRAIEALRRGLQVDPCDERIARELMRLLARGQRRAEARRVYEQLVESLREELGIEPSPGTVELERQIAAGELGSSRNRDASHPAAPPDRPLQPAPANGPPPPDPPAGPGAELPAPARSSIAPGPTPVGPASTPLPSPARTPRPRSLPAEVTSFVGRKRALAAARDRVLTPDVRLLTLTGTGGAGKTRLAVRVAAEVAPHFDGVAFVDLTAIADPGLIVPAIARALGVREVEGRTLTEVLHDALFERHLLLLLDNFEQLLPAGAIPVAELLRACPGVKVLVTSRASLRLYGEHCFEVRPLALPSHTPLPTLETLERNPAVRLFVERAQAVRPDLRITADNAAAIVAICRRLDGLPLAIELAAARSRLLSPQEMLARRKGRLDLPADGEADRPERHKTLERTIAWSYDLLTDAQRRLFRRLAVFVGGCTLEAAEAVVGAAEYDTREGLLVGLESLVDHNLLWRVGDGDERRFAMLPTIRAYALDRLDADAEGVDVRGRHADWCLALAGGGPRPHALIFPTRHPSTMPLRIVEREHGNLRAALQWLCRTGSRDRALRLANAMFDLWYDRGFFSEGLARLRDALGLSGQADRTEPGAAERTEPRAVALWFAGVLSRYAGTPADAQAYQEEALDIFRHLGDPDGQAQTLAALGRIALEEGETERARALQEQALVLAREAGARRTLAWTLHGRALTAEQSGDPALARQLHEESLAIRLELAYPSEISWSRIDLAYLAIRAGDRAVARRMLAACPSLGGEDDTPPTVAAALECGAALALLEARSELALQLIGAAAALREQTGASAVGRLRQRVDILVDAARAGLDDRRAADAAYDEGGNLAPEQAAALVLADPSGSAQSGAERATEGPPVAYGGDARAGRFHPPLGAPDRRAEAGSGAGRAVPSTLPG